MFGTNDNPDGTDTFRIKIWYEEGGSELLVDDNGFDQAIGGGNPHKAELFPLLDVHVEPAFHGYDESLSGEHDQRRFDGLNDERCVAETGIDFNRLEQHPSR